MVAAWTRQGSTTGSTGVPFTLRTPSDTQNKLDDVLFPRLVRLPIGGELDFQRPLRALVLDPGLGVASQASTEGQVVLPLQPTVLNDVHVRDAVPRPRLEDEDQPAVVAGVSAVLPSSGDEWLLDIVQLGFIGDAEGEIEDRLGKEPGNRGRPDVLDGDDSITKKGRHLRRKIRTNRLPLLARHDEGHGSVVETKTAGAKLVHRTSLPRFSVSGLNRMRIIRRMPRMQVYLPDDLYAEVKGRQMPASELLQDAVRAELRRRELAEAADVYLADLVAETGKPTRRELAKAEAIVHGIRDAAAPTQRVT